MKLTAADKWAIRWIIDRHHVADTDADILADINRRIDKTEKVRHLPEHLKTQMREYALKHHHDNQGIVKKFNL